MSQCAALLCGGLLCPGTEAGIIALRACKAITGKRKILKFEGGYHGFCDQACVSLLPNLQVCLAVPH